MLYYLLSYAYHRWFQVAVCEFVLRILFVAGMYTLFYFLTVCVYIHSWFMPGGNGNYRKYMPLIDTFFIFR